APPGAIRVTFSQFFFVSRHRNRVAIRDRHANQETERRGANHVRQRLTANCLYAFSSWMFLSMGSATTGCRRAPFRRRGPRQAAPLACIPCRRLHCSRLAPDHILECVRMILDAQLSSPSRPPSLACRFTLWRPADGRVFDLFAFDCETTEIDFDRPEQTPT